MLLPFPATSEPALCWPAVLGTRCIPALCNRGFDQATTAGSADLGAEVEIVPEVDSVLFCGLALPLYCLGFPFPSFRCARHSAPVASGSRLLYSVKALLFQRRPGSGLIDGEARFLSELSQTVASHPLAPIGEVAEDPGA